VPSSWAGIDQAIKQTQAIVAKADAAARTIVTKGSAVVEAETKKNFQGSHAKGQPHVGGSQPNVVSGTARRSITTTRASRTALGIWSATTGPTVVYGRRLELGYPGGGAGRGLQMTRAFPYFAPGTRTAQQKVDAIAVTAARSITT
jgi:hypothetical protein